jgi:hypothetical protein
MGTHTHTHTDWWEGFIKLAVVMGSCAMIYSYIPRFVETGSDIRKLIEVGIHRHTDNKVIS